MLTARQIQEIADKCLFYGYNFHLAITTAARDGTPWYRTETPDQEFARLASAS